MIACVWEEVNSFATSDFSWGKACAFQRVKTMDPWAHVIGYAVIWIDFYIVFVGMKSMCLRKLTIWETWALNALL
jgi:hypothetical protein